MKLSVSSVILMLLVLFSTKLLSSFPFMLVFFESLFNSDDVPFVHMLIGKMDDGGGS